MKSKILKKLSKISLIISIVPLATLIPVFLNITLAEGVRTVWACTNIACVVVSLVLSIICAKSVESRSVVTIISIVISGFLGLLMLGIVALTLVFNVVR